jgi:DNA repair protein RecO (recombination protein O)
LQPGYVLHRRAYRDTSAILELFTLEHGRLSVVARGVRRAPRGNVAGRISAQLFQPLLLSFSGRGELKTLGASEAAGPAHGLRGERLYSGLYVNELLVRLLHRYDAHPGLFAQYGDTLQGLAGDESVEVVLRRFEMSLLDELGYGFDLGVDGQTGEAVREEAWYHYHGDHGLVERSGGLDPERPAYAGADLLAIAEGRMAGDAGQTAKRLLREALASHLGDTPLKSRDLFRRANRDSGKEHKA